MVSRTVRRTYRELQICCLVLSGRLILFDGLWPPPLLRWWLLRMRIIKYFFCFFFLALLCSQALQFSLLRPCLSRWAPSGHRVFWVGCFAGSSVFFFACIGRFTNNHQPFIIPFSRPLGGFRYMPPTESDELYR
jgi:hypothetical protein